MMLRVQRLHAEREHGSAHKRCCAMPFTLIFAAYSTVQCPGIWSSEEPASGEGFRYILNTVLTAY